MSPSLPRPPSGAWPCRPSRSGRLRPGALLLSLTLLCLWGASPARAAGPAGEAGAPISARAGAQAPRAEAVVPPELEGRVLRLTKELRCLVCQGESIADSGSDFAADVRRKVVELMEQGYSDRQIKEYLVQRYGDFILFRPPLKATTLFLWVGPFLLLLAGGTALLVSIRRRRARLQAEAAPLSAEEEARVRALLEAGQAGPRASGGGDVQEGAREGGR